MPTKRKTIFTKDAAHALVIEELKKKHAAELAEAARAKAQALSEAGARYMADLTKRENEYRKEVGELQNEIAAQVSKYEAAHVRFIDASIEREGIDSMRRHYELLYKKHMRRCVENGFRRAQTDPNYAVLREFLHAGKNLAELDYVEIGKKHPEATIFGLVQIAEELGYHIKADLKLREEMKKQKAGLWSIGIDYMDVLSSIMDTITTQSVDDINAAEDKKVMEDVAAATKG